MHLQEAVVGIRLTREQRLDLRPRGTLRDRGDDRLALADRGLVAFALAQLDEDRRVIELALERADRRQPGFEIGAFAHRRLSLRRVVPQRGAFGENVQFRETSLGFVPVKDASSAVRWTAWRLRAEPRSRRAWRDGLATVAAGRNARRKGADEIGKASLLVKRGRSRGRPRRHVSGRAVAAMD